ncbi:hypothetical protein COD19_17340 [Bacillus cereus]|uniref:Uncharacterized protein n=1 Tax=Bacillus cereus TaxID=1396 RepID=A0A2C1LQ62_BACCE|nr:hypothetical protein COD19_17340 [Bacillus cereus]
MNLVLYAILMIVIAIMFILGILFWGRVRRNYKKQHLHNTNLKKGRNDICLFLIDYYFFMF